jgi:hypothetical protein
MQTEPHTLPPKPQAPQDYDCCGGGCADCELKIYLRALAEWNRLAADFAATQDCSEKSDH